MRDKLKMRITTIYLIIFIITTPGCSVTSSICGRAELNDSVKSVKNSYTPTDTVALSEPEQIKSPVGYPGYDHGDLFTDEGLAEMSFNKTVVRSYEKNRIKLSNPKEIEQYAIHTQSPDKAEQQAFTGLLSGIVSVLLVAIGLLFIILNGYILFWPFLLSLILSITGFSFSRKSFKYLKSHSVSEKVKLNSLWGLWLNGSVLSFYIFCVVAFFVLYFVFHAFIIYENMPR